jgi:hypothetical protein
MHVVKAVSVALIATAVTVAFTRPSEAASLPTSVAAVKAAVGQNIVQVRWRGSHGGWSYHGRGFGGWGHGGWGYRGWGLGAAAAGAIAAGTIARSAYYGYPYYADYGGTYAYDYCSPSYGYGAYSPAYYAPPRYYDYGW